MSCTFDVVLVSAAEATLLATIQQALLDLLRPHLMRLPWTVDRRSGTDRSHAAIYAALVAGDSAAARAAMRDHLSLAYDSLLCDVQRLPAPTNGVHHNGDAPPAPASNRPRRKAVAR